MVNVTADVPTVEHGGLLWKPKPAATATADEFVAARTRIVELQHDSRWDPWEMDDHQADWDAAAAVFAQWTRAEPGFRPKTSRQVDARMDRKFEAKRKRRDREHEQNKKCYDADREQARLALLEDRAQEQHLVAELDEYRSGRRFPLMAANKRQAKMSELQDQIAACQARIERLTPVAGDMEDVVDQRGWLPRDRRELSLSMYRFDREQEVCALRAAVVEHEAALKAANDKTERAEIRQTLQDARYNSMGGWQCRR